MPAPITLEDHLAAWAGDDPRRHAVARVIRGMADAGVELSRLIGRGGREANLAAVVGDGGGGDAQKGLDLLAHQLVRAKMIAAGVREFGSEEAEEAEVLDPAGLVAVATDPLDGSSNIDTNLSIGTIFAVLPTDGAGDPLLRPGRDQLAAGYVVYGPHTNLVFTCGDGVAEFTLDRDDGTWVATARAHRIPPETNEFAINASNYRHWSPGTRQYYDDLITGAIGIRAKDFNMRWLASLVAETTRILARGGMFLYPRDHRKGFGNGRLRLVYEANPIALIVEQAGGRASDGVTRVLDVVPETLHQRTPLYFGAANEVARLELYKANPTVPEKASLFEKSGLSPA
jgi:fructose-1,6-bisphosphatase I